jgi:SAM-dependent methyltransferase
MGDPADVDEYLSGRKLLGDEYTPEEISEWFQDEAEAYSDLVGKNAGGYGYHALNTRYGFNRLPKVRFRNVLGFGSADGQELKPIIDRLEKVTVVEPSDAFIRSEVEGVPVAYVKPNPQGTLPFPDNSFDLILSFGALHHIPNVSRVVGEFSRCLAKGGHALIREPTVSLGDWRKNRPGLTKRERGIPLDIFRRILAEKWLIVEYEKQCMFPITGKLHSLGISPYNSNIILTLDEIICSLFNWNRTYYPRNILDRLRPTSVFYVLRKN